MVDCCATETRVGESESHSIKRTDGNCSFWRRGYPYPIISVSTCMRPIRYQLRVRPARLVVLFVDDDVCCDVRQESSQQLRPSSHVRVHTWCGAGTPGEPTQSNRGSWGTWVVLRGRNLVPPSCALYRCSMERELLRDPSPKVSILTSARPRWRKIWHLGQLG